MNTDAWLDQHHAYISDTIRAHGWSIQYIGGGACSRPGCACPPDDEPPFAYTTGLFGLDHPELLLFGVGPSLSQQILNTLAERIRSGERLMPGLPVTCAGWSHTIIPEDVPNPGDIVLWANRFYRRPAEYSVPALQLTYDDHNGRFPWDEDCAVADLQPRPGTFTA